MANRNNNFVHIKVDRNYFDNVFEPERRSLQNKLGVNLTQPKFTAYLGKVGAKIQYPKRNNTFAPKKKRNQYRFTI